MSVKLHLDSDKIDGDTMFSLKAFLGEIQLTDLLAINKLVVDETNERINTICEISFGRK